MSTTRVMGFPGRYLQGPGLLAEVGNLLRDLGCQKPVLVSDDIVDAALGTRVPESLARAGLSAQRLRFGGECTRDSISTLANQARLAQADAVIALGGGKTIDTAKGVARELGSRLIIAPTVASNDSPTSRLIVIYDQAHRLVGVDYLVRNPDAVLVDTEVIVQAPVRFFRAGIGDAISKRYEAAQCAKAGGLNFFGGLPTDTAGLLARRCHEVIVQYGQTALADVEVHRVTPAVESVVEATVLLSGLGFESGGLSLSHALLRGLSAVPELAASLHGEQVAFGTLVQLILEQRPDVEVAEHHSLLRRLGLPTTLRELGLAKLSLAQLDDVGQRTMSAPYIANFDHQLDAQTIVQAVLCADGLTGA